MGNCLSNKPCTQDPNEHSLPTPQRTLQQPPVYYVPDNARQVLDFSNPNTPESRALSALTSNDADGKSISLVAMGGAGKTTILRALGTHPHIWQKFPDGIWFLELGHDVTTNAFVEKLQVLVTDAFPDFLPEFIRLSTSDHTRDTMINKLTRRLAARRFLLILDDVWDVNRTVFDLVDSLCKTLNRMNDSSLKLLTSTRNWGICRAPMHDVCIDANPVQADTATARRILCCYAQVDVSELSSLSIENHEALNSILQTCAGLPLALSVAGSSILGMKNASVALQNQNVLVQYWQILNSNVLRLAHDGCGGHDGLLASLQCSLQLLNDNWNIAAISVNKMFRSLCIMQKQTCLPFCAIEKLWGVSYEVAVDAVLALSKNSIVILVREIVKKESIVGIKLHDLVHDLSVAMARCEEGIGMWHETLLDGYCHSTTISDSTSTANEQAYSAAEWWGRIPQDNYFADNVVRHMVGAGRETDALQLLTNYRWIQMMNDNQDRVPFQKIVSDLKVLSQNLEQESWSVKSFAPDLDAIAETMVLSMSPYCIENPEQCTFQLEGRLTALKSESPIVKRLLWSIEKYGRVPWARAGPGVLSSARSGLKRVLYMDHAVLCMAMGMKRNEFIVGGLDGEMRSADTNDGSTECVFDEKHGDWIVAVHVDRESGLIYSSSRKGVVMVWKDQKRISSFDVYSEEQDKNISCMEVLCLQQVIAFGTEEGPLVILDLPSGTSKFVDGHTRWVKSLVVKQNEGILLSGSWDGTIRFWNTHTFEPIRNVQGRRLARVNCLELSGDGTLLASALEDGKVQLRETATYCEVWQSSAGHEWDVTCVTFSCDGQQMYSGDDNGTLCVWNVVNGGKDTSLMHTFHHAPMGQLKSLCLVGESSELFVISDFSNQVHVWDTEAMSIDNDRSDETTKFLSDVKGLAISEDEATMATWNASQHTIEVRNMTDVSRNHDRVVSNFPIGDDKFVARMAVSNDHLVAFTSIHDFAFRIIDMKSGTELDISSEFESWTPFVSQTMLERMQTLRFSSDGSMMMAIDPVDLVYTAARKSEASQVVTGEPMQLATVGEITTSSKSTKQSSLPGSDSLIAVPRLFCKKDMIVSFFSDVQFDDGTERFTIASTEHEPTCIHYCTNSSRLWISRSTGGVEYIDLIYHQNQFAKRDEPELPELSCARSARRHPRRITTRGNGSNEKACDVFISHAGPDKQFIAEPLYHALVALGLKVFLDKMELQPGQNAPQKMNREMETARVAVVILSPEFAARPWTMKELLCFLRRFRRAGERGVIIIPVFYRLTLEDCRNALEIVDEDGNKVLMTAEFLQRLAQNSEYGIADVVGGLREMRSITGIENSEGATNGAGNEAAGRRKALVERVVEAVVKAFERSAESNLET